MIFIKRLFAKKTESISDDKSKELVGLFKELQKNSEELAKQSRKIKQLLKSNKDVENPDVIRQVASKLLTGRDSTLIANHMEIMRIISKIVGELEIPEPVRISLEKVIQQEENAIRIANQNIQKK